jgi:hypothetical protein
MMLKLFVLLMSHEWEMLLASKCDINMLGDEGTSCCTVVLSLWHTICGGSDWW